MKDSIQQLYSSKISSNPKVLCQIVGEIRILKYLIDREDRKKIFDSKEASLRKHEEIVPNKRIHSDQKNHLDDKQHIVVLDEES